ncbi:type II CRISPR-associated endonuclease Cas1 [Zavarzinia sp.]|uniref:type II CRISPR-associated endonuclease Cas1 n=1 Tax=Zavarzinia sp. TaxID=2027920 RepID=UPI003BB7A9AC|nr:type II CRISPR-associated endonuclease Cas1 [Zavarzinia sp.]
MIGRVVEIATDGRFLALDRGFLTVSEKGEEVGRVPLDSIAAVVANAHGLGFTNNILVELSRRGIPVVLCGANHRPEAIVWPVEGHHQQAGRIADQIAAALPLKKRLWAQVVKAKILAQGASLAAVGARHGGFQLLAAKVRSGDPDNVEAEAARRYWPLLMGPEFRRDRDAEGANALLNYGYAVLRAGVARAVMAGGLHPSLGLMHANRGNAMVLVDDLMEPFRPVVDIEVWRLLRAGTIQVDREAKAALARVMVLDLPTSEGTSPVMTCAERLVNSVAKAFAGEGDRLALPLPRLPLEGWGE